LVDQDYKIYARKAVPVRQYPHFKQEESGKKASAGAPGVGEPPQRPVDLQREADRLVLAQYAPAGVLVDDSLNILQFRGYTSPYLAPAAGEASQNLLKMTREGLFPELRLAIEKARAQNVAVCKPGVRVRDDRKVRVIDLQVIPVKPAGSGEGCFLVLFVEPS